MRKIHFTNVLLNTFFLNILNLINNIQYFKYVLLEQFLNTIFFKNKLYVKYKFNLSFIQLIVLINQLNNTHSCTCLQLLKFLMQFFVFFNFNFIRHAKTYYQKDNCVFDRFEFVSIGLSQLLNHIYKHINIYVFFFNIFIIRNQSIFHKS